MRPAVTRRGAILAVAGLLVVAQAVRPARTNPPVDPHKTLLASGHPPPHVSAIFDRACRDCHSSLTRWPWYSNVAPVSWVLADHVEEGRRELSFSNWGDYDERRLALTLKEMCEQVREGEMPLGIYLLLHPEAKLTNDDREAICRWTQAERARLGVATVGDEADGNERR